MQGIISGGSKQALGGGRRGKDNFEIGCSTTAQATVEVLWGLVAVLPVSEPFGALQYVDSLGKAEGCW